MIRTMRQKFGPVIIGIIVGFIAFVFIFLGVDPLGGGGGGSGSLAGSVNGLPITYSEFNRALNQRMEFFKNMKLDAKAVKQFRIRESVFQDLVNRKLMLQEAERRNLLPADEAVRDTIRNIPAFQKDGRFDRVRYKRLLKANQFTASGFERQVRDDLVMQKWRDYFKGFALASEKEIEKEYWAQNDKRVIKYVLIDQAMGRKGVTVSKKEIQAYLKDKEKEKMVRNRYNLEKKTKHKKKSFAQAKPLIVRDLLLVGKQAEISKFNQGLATKVVKHLTAGKTNDAKVNALIQKYGGKIKTTTPVTRTATFIPGIGRSDQLLKESFVVKGPLTKKAKTFAVPSGVLVAVVAKVMPADLKKLSSKERDSIRTRLKSQKERQLFGAWMKGLAEKAKITKNDKIVNES